MAINLKLPKSKKTNTVKMGDLPTKDFINIQIKKKQSFNMKKHLPIIIILALLFLVLCKFFVIDRLVEISEGTDRINAMHAELDKANKQISDLSDLEDDYAHYTTNGMTKEELSRVDRVKAMKMVDKAFTGGVKADSWNLTGNVMTLQVSGPSLSRLNKLAEDLEENSIVERCVISTANKGLDSKGNVVVSFTIYLQQSIGNTDKGE